MINALRLLKHNGLDVFGNPSDWDDPGPLQTLPDGSPPDTGSPNPASGLVVGGQTPLYAPDGSSSSTAGGGGTSGAMGSTTATTTGSALAINISWDSSVSSAPIGFTTAVLAAVQYLENQFTDAVTVNISIGWGEVNGTSLGSNALGESESYLSSYSYSSLRSAGASDATSADDQSAVASLPSSAPVSGKFWTTTAEAKALGLSATNGTSTDGFIGFSSSLPFTFNDSSGVASGTYDFNGVALHEMTEVLGRMLFAGTTVAGYANSYTLLDLLHYAGAGTRDFSASTPGYLSVDGGKTDLGNFNTVSGGDAGDWASSMGYDSFDAFSSSGVVNPVTTNDLREIDAIGWNRAGIVAEKPMTSALAAAQGTNGVAAGATLASVAQTGMPVGDSYTYAMGGSGAGSFTLTAANNAATLAAGSGGVAGGVNGLLYALTITPTDTTAGTTGPASTLDIIVASSGADTVNIATLSSALGKVTPTFVYGLAGNDTLNGSGMTGKLFLDGGAGADKLTGGGGINDYLYGATSDSTTSAMDTITNFATAKDLIDLSGLGVSLAYAGKLSGTTLAADSIGWQVSNSTTYVYVNTTSGSEGLSSTDMKIGLTGSLSMTSQNFVHL